MSDTDSSEDEDLSRFNEAVDTSFTKLIKLSRDPTLTENTTNDAVKAKSERYLEEASHYNDVKVSDEMQRRIGAKVSGVIGKNVEFVAVPQNDLKKRKIKGGVKLFSTSEGFLSCEEPKDTYTDTHNQKAKKLKKTQRVVENNDLDEEDKVNMAVISGEFILSKEETKCWKSRRKEKVFKYKRTTGKSNILEAVE